MSRDFNPNLLGRIVNEWKENATTVGPSNPPASLRREKSPNEVGGANASEAKAAKYHYVFCTHNVPYWRPCTKCGRDKELAKRNADLVLRSIGGAAFFTK